MRRRQNLPRQWLFTDARISDDLWAALRRLPPGSGVIVRQPELLNRIRRIGRARALTVIDERDGQVARVHDSAELRRALTRNVPVIFVSSLYSTRSHPERAPLPRMRAATLARLAHGRAFALGGMDAERFAAVQRLGFAGWGGIDAWLKGPSRE
jgi:thiamine-phosphate pyrophosphorylase